MFNFTNNDSTILDPQHSSFQDKAFETARKEAFTIFETCFPTGVFLTGLWGAYQKMSAKRNVVDVLPLIPFSVLNSLDLSAAPLMTAWQCMRFAAKSFDDAEDEIGETAQKINRGTAFLFAAQQILLKLGDSGLYKDRYREVIRQFNLAGMTASEGQAEDLSVQNGDTLIDPDTWMKIVFKKSGALFGWAAWSGACLAGASNEALESWRNFGQTLGILVQINDDFESVWGRNGSGDMDVFRVSLPYVYAFHVTPPDKKEILLKLIEEENEIKPAKKQAVQDLLIHLGAQKFMLAAIIDQRQKAINAIENDIGGDSSRLHYIIGFVEKICPSIIRKMI